MKKYGEWSLQVRYTVFAIVLLLVSLTLWYIHGVLKPLIIAAFIAYVIHPAVNFLLARTRLSRFAAVNLVYFVSLAIFIGVPVTLTPLLFNEFSRVSTDVLASINNLISALEKPNLIPGLPMDFGPLANRLTQFRSTFLTSLPNQLIQLISQTSVGALWLLVILVAVYYLLAKWPNMRTGFINMFPKKYNAELHELYLRVRRIWISYLRGQLLLMLIVGTVFTIAWAIIGLPGALVLGLIAGFLTLIPDVGPTLAAALAVVVALLEGSTWWPAAPYWLIAAVVLAVYMVMMGIKNFWLRPFIMGRSVHMHEALVFISIILATVLWGILGALLVVPVLATLIVVLDYLRRRILGMPPFPEAEPFVSDEPPAAPAVQLAALKSKITPKKGKDTE